MRRIRIGRCMARVVTALHRSSHPATDLCVHNVRPSACRLCGAAHFCPHGKQPSRCYQCWGEHRRSSCFHCRHGKRPTRCAECTPGNFCGHGRLHAVSSECRIDNISVCPHGKWQHLCSACSGAGVCPHGRLRGMCHLCALSVRCEHEKNRYNCRVCSPGVRCRHNLRRSKCQRCCKSHRLCVHGKVWESCRVCGASTHHVVLDSRRQCRDRGQ